jgi:ectoine hydroxylase-related dioxygenase (phytanoyl-CoA dioxygenase family)
MNPVCSPHNTLVPLRWNDEPVRISLSAPGLINRIRTALSATDLRWISGYLSVKEPSSGPLWWHQDRWAWDHPVTFEPECSQAAVLIYLNATSTDNGALRIVPGSHHRSHPLHAHLPEPHSAEISETQDTLPAMQDAADQVTLAAGEGDAVVMDYRLLHGTHPNNSADRRIAVMLNFVPSWTDLPDDVKGHLIQHPALPDPRERGHVTSVQRSILPDYQGRRADLQINRKPPIRFAIGPSRPIPERVRDEAQ